MGVTPRPMHDAKLATWLWGWPTSTSMAPQSLACGTPLLLAQVKPGIRSCSTLAAVAALTCSSRLGGCSRLRTPGGMESGGR